MLLIFHIHTPSGKTEKKHMSYTNKKKENGKLQIQQLSSLTFPFQLLKVPNFFLWANWIEIVVS